MANVASLAIPVKASQQVVKVGEEVKPSEEVGGSGSKAKIPSVSALMGWSLTESAGATAKFRLWDGEGTTGSAKLLSSVSLTAGSSSNVSIPVGASLVNGGIYLERVSGEVEGSVFWSE